MSKQEQAGRFSAAKAAISVPVYFHVVPSSHTKADGNISDASLDQQLAVINDNYAPYDISFTLASTDRTVNADWTVDGAEVDMKTALRKGDYKTLNLYFLKDLGGAFGYCYFPTEAAEDSEDFIFDGCSISSTTVLGGPETNFNEGKTVTHGVGHRFGLFHTFQDSSCSGDGGCIVDTRQQLSPTSGCLEGRDSCPNANGLDPIHKYMDYSYDSCYEELTAGQNERMHNMFDQYRA